MSQIGLHGCRIITSILLSKLSYFATMKRKNFNIEPSNRSKSNKSTKIDDDIRMRLWINASQEPSSNLSATRYVPPLRAPTLKELSISIIVDKFKQLYESSRDTFVESFRRLPDFDRETLGDAIMTKYADLMSITLIREVSKVAML